MKLGTKGATDRRKKRPRPHRGFLSRRLTATVEQVVAGAGLGDADLHERARDVNTARLTRAISALLEDLGLLLPDGSDFKNNSNLWRRAYFKLAKRYGSPFALLRNLGILPPDGYSPFTAGQNFWFRAFFTLAKRYVRAFGPLRIPGIAGRPLSSVAKDRVATDSEIEAAVRGRRNESVRAVCEELATSKLGANATRAKTRREARRLEYRFFNRNRPRKVAGSE